MMIDTPSPFATLAEWREFVRDLRAAADDYGDFPEQAEAIAEEIKSAEIIIRKLEDAGVSSGIELPVRELLG